MYVILHQFNDIAREIYVNGAWESWLSDHLVKSMINYLEAVLLGEPGSCDSSSRGSVYRYWI